MFYRNDRKRCRMIALFGAASFIFTLSALASQPHPLMGVLESELQLSMDKLEAPDGTKPYYIQYTVTDTKSQYISASLGAIVSENDDHSRYLDVDIRCGDYTLDSTHQIRGSYSSDYGQGSGSCPLPIIDDPLVVRKQIWMTTDETFKQEAKRLAEVKANLKTMVEEEDQSDDFSKEEPQTSIEPWIEQSIDMEAWGKKLRKYSKVFNDHPNIYSSRITLSGNVQNRVTVNSEGSKIQFGLSYWRVSVSASTIAEDGMELSQYDAFDSHTPDGLPSDEDIMKSIQKVILEVEALRDAPIVDPYTGPAILMNRSCGVFFHEIFGHRIEGHRQKDVEEGQTFAKKLGQEVLPTFLSVVDDPTQKTFNGVDLRGYYPFDDECVKTQPVELIKDGILETFLMSRSPARGVTQSNGHGRRDPGGNRIVSRQGNLFVQSEKKVPYEKLREMLIEECKKQDKEYGLVFKDISGGFTNTRAWNPQAFKVNPLVVYRVYADGRPDELVRGVDIVGTPLTCFSKILCAADDDAVFNGTCGAESGPVPVSAIAPSVLIQEVEVEKKKKSQNRPPILPSPIAEKKAEKTTEQK